MNTEGVTNMAGGEQESVMRKEDVEAGLQATMEEIGAIEIPALEEVNIFKDDEVIQFTNPKVEASLEANTWVISGSPKTEKMEVILPRLMNALGSDGLENLRMLAEQFQKYRLGEEDDTQEDEEENEEDDFH